MNKSLIISFLSGLTITIISFFNKPVSCVKPMFIQLFWYDYGFIIGTTIMTLSIIIYLITISKQPVNQVSKK